MSLLEQITEKARQLSPQHQQETLDFIEFLAWKEALQKSPKVSMSFSWRGCLKELKQTALEAQKEILERRGAK
ncbi:MAG: DUF2281 domain-containing protein [Chloroherpetonaceae bacterium]|nr:DUF2281 domain-containing protein [Chloroherpetonaceae bacterium]MCS7211249.1 DUF2281 domain-containing protein [Chloroherpetonaceae bacterium]MDW8019238.1 DUF2281 domain-containing protein [Chloroherpetonaceae bacterium]MDW8464807.1 DUF2281 domain-containing protein [Chloroherpetonaceae bacterium]